MRECCKQLYPSTSRNLRASSGRVATKADWSGSGSRMAPQLLQKYSRWARRSPRVLAAFMEQSSNPCGLLEEVERALPSVFYRLIWPQCQNQTRTVKIKVSRIYDCTRGALRRWSESTKLRTPWECCLTFRKDVSMLVHVMNRLKEKSCHFNSYRKRTW